MPPSKASEKSNKVLKELKILKIQQTTIEKDNNAILESIRNKDLDFFNPLLTSRKKIVDSRLKQSFKHNNRVNLIKEDIGNITKILKIAQSENKDQVNYQNNGQSGGQNESKKSQIVDNQTLCQTPLQKVNISKLRSDMENISIKLEKFKSEQAQDYEKLLQEYNLYDSELAALNRRLIYDTTKHKIQDKKISVRALNNNRPGTAPARGTSSSNSNSSGGLPEEVTAYQNFLILNGGLNGGWDDFDHNNFIKFYKTTNSDPDKFLETCIINLPGKSIENIKTHRIWYENFLQLLEDKKAAIENWKRIKNYEKSKIINDGKMGIILIHQDSLDDQQDKFEKMKEELAKKKLIEQRKKAKEQVLSWKESKSLQEKMAKENLERRRREEASRKEALEKKRTVEIKTTVELYKLEKRAIDEIKVEELNAKKLAEQKLKSKKASETLPKFQERDAIIAQKKMLMKEIDSYEQQVKNERLERIKKTVRPKSSRDFNRLTKLTKSAESRVLAERDSVNPTVGSRGMPSRNVPSWRAGLNL